ncbi:endothelial differentiation-related factor 1 homolog [Diadema antillarum]|uniref:endothelial differentiation-related factor 1 homolog n=1 Tax=Diadema antillarum TaxID=105358 RepID=UPI003A881A19
MAEADWDEVTYLRKKTPRAAQLRSQQAVNAAQRKGAQVDTTKKYNAGGNRQHMNNKDTAKLDRETEELHHNRVSMDVGKIIQRARQEKNFTQKDLATKINEKPQVINDYEAGRAIPNNQIFNKLERVLGVKLRGKDKGKPMGGKK